MQWLSERALPSTQDDLGPFNCPSMYFTLHCNIQGRPEWVSKVKLFARALIFTKSGFSGERNTGKCILLLIKSSDCLTCKTEKAQIVNSDNLSRVKSLCAPCSTIDNFPLWAFLVQGSDSGCTGHGNGLLSFNSLGLVSDSHQLLNINAVGTRYQMWLTFIYLPPTPSPTHPKKHWNNREYFSEPRSVLQNGTFSWFDHPRLEFDLDILSFSNAEVEKWASDDKLTTSLSWMLLSLHERNSAPILAMQHYHYHHFQHIKLKFDQFVTETRPSKLWES